METAKVQHLRVALISDTHGHWDDALARAVDGADELWHAGDLGPMTDHLEAWEAAKPGRKVRAITGNIDGYPLTRSYPAELDFTTAGVRVWMIHIGGYPGRFSPGVRAAWPNKLAYGPVNLFVCGHSHILRVARDPFSQALCLNPGAAGIHGFHHIRTLLRFELSDGTVKNMEAVELGLRGKTALDPTLADPY
jgi:predicted phosphodiesterase